MVQILPFRGLRYSLADGATLSDVTAPPYDVIEPDHQARLYDRHPANVVRLILNRKQPGDHADQNPYTRADGFLRQWQREGVLAADARPSLIAYSQRWTPSGYATPVERKGMIALLRLSPPEEHCVLPHERTIDKYVSDRITLSKTAGANLSQIFMIYADPERLVERVLFESPSAQESASWQEAVDEDGVVHRLRMIDDAPTLSALQRHFDDKTLLIADGHHRYKTALTLQREARARILAQTGQSPAPGSLLSDYVMAFFANMDDPGLLVFPTHRALTRWPQGWSRERLEAALQDTFECLPPEAFAADPQTILYEGQGGAPRWTLRLKHPDSLGDLPAVMRDFDAAILDRVVIEGYFASDAPRLKADHILWFDRNEASVQGMTARGKAVAAFYLHAPSVRHVQRICAAGELMPQKSTYFYPKILSGLTLYSHRAFEAAEGHALSGVVENASPLPTDFWPQEAGVGA